MPWATAGPASRHDGANAPGGRRKYRGETTADAYARCRVSPFCAPLPRARHSHGRTADDVSRNPGGTYGGRSRRVAAGADGAALRAPAGAARVQLRDHAVRGRRRRQVRRASARAASGRAAPLHVRRAGNGAGARPRAAAGRTLKEQHTEEGAMSNLKVFLLMAGMTAIFGAV